MELRKTFRFEASHILPKHPGKCSRLHGHSWVLHVSVRGAVSQDTGFVQDYADISKVVKPIVDGLDHRHLGTWPTLNLPYSPSWDVNNFSYPDNFYPSSENLLWWIASQLHGLDVPRLGPLGTFIGVESYWSSVALEETCTSYAILTREEFNERSPGSVRAAVEQKR